MKLPRVQFTRLGSILRPCFRFQAALEAIVAGLALGLADVHSTNEDWFDSIFAYFIVAFVLGMRHARQAWQAWIPLGSSLYVMHRAAIAYGYQPPYVEVDQDAAVRCLFALWPAGLGLALGAVIRCGISWISSVIHSSLVTTNQGPPATFYPEPKTSVIKKTHACTICTSIKSSSSGRTFYCSGSWPDLGASNFILTSPTIPSCLDGLQGSGVRTH